MRKPRLRGPAEDHYAKADLFRSHSAPLAMLVAAQEKQQTNTFKRLAAPTTQRGYQCAKGAAWFYPNGTLRTCEVARDTAFGEAIVPAGSFIYLLDNGTPSYVFLSRNTGIHRHVCRRVSHDLMTSFYPGGQLKVCWLAARKSNASRARR